MSNNKIYEYDGYTMPPLFKGEMTPKVIEEKEKNHREVEKRKMNLLKKLGRI